MKRAIFIFIFLIICSLSILSIKEVFASIFKLAEHFDDNSDNGYVDCWYPYLSGQTFTVNNSAHTIDIVGCKLYKKGTPPNPLVVNILLADVNHKPTGSNLTSGSINPSGITTTTTGAWYNISVTSYNLLANIEYCFVLSTTRSDDNNAVYQRDNFDRRLF